MFRFAVPILVLLWGGEGAADEDPAGGALECVEGGAFPVPSHLTEYVVPSWAWTPDNPSVSLPYSIGGELLESGESIVVTQIPTPVTIMPLNESFEVLFQATDGVETHECGFFLTPFWEAVVDVAEPPVVRLTGLKQDLGAVETFVYPNVPRLQAWATDPVTGDRMDASLYLGYEKYSEDATIGLGLHLVFANTSFTSDGVQGTLGPIYFEVLGVPRLEASIAVEDLVCVPENDTVSIYTTVLVASTDFDIHEVAETSIHLMPLSRGGIDLSILGGQRPELVHVTRTSGYWQLMFVAERLIECPAYFEVIGSGGGESNSSDPFTFEARVIAEEDQILATGSAASRSELGVSHSICEPNCIANGFANRTTHFIVEHARSYHSGRSGRYWIHQRSCS